MSDPLPPPDPPAAGAVPPDQLRPGDADRKAVADKLRRGVDEGRLDLHEYDERLRQAYAATTYGDLGRIVADLPGAVEPEGPVLVRLGEIAVTSTTIYTPAGSAPLRGSRWAGEDQWLEEQKIPTWAIVVAIVGIFVICLFSLLFLLVKENTLRGTVRVTVFNGQQRYTAMVPVTSLAHVYHIHQQVSYLNSLANQ